VGPDSSRCRPPTRDVRQRYRERCRRMLLGTGVPGVPPAQGGMPMLIRLAEQDNVAVATKTLAKGTKVEVDGVALTTRDAIPFAHKVAIRAIEQDAQVFKYGVPIGRAKVAIEPGRHVHVHNIRSDYVNNEVDFFEEAGAEDAPEGGREGVRS
jgi:3D (Asp-Asp-Asp) domain-containing protein